MKWTRKHPIQPGFSWYWDEHRAAVLEVLARLGSCGGCATSKDVAGGMGSVRG
ncbi:MAG: hypothetical protein K0S58_1037 [Nitrospira sp.]|jgi:hypothetical protein|nr:hypothetical protein [Nitrospira sp.]